MAKTKAAKVVAGGREFTGKLKTRTTRHYYHDAYTEKVVTDADGFDLAYYYAGEGLAGTALAGYDGIELDAPVTVVV